MMNKAKSIKYLYSINGEGEYTPTEVRQITGRLNAARQQHGIKKVKQIMWHFSDELHKDIRAENLIKLSEKACYSAGHLGMVHNHPEVSKRMKVWTTWEDIDGYRESIKRD